MSTARHDVPLSELTTLRLGGPARTLYEPETEEELVGLVASESDALLIAGGSNLVIADEGWPGTAILVRTLGVGIGSGPEEVTVTAAAGEPWDSLVARCVAEGLAGIECLSGIPGSVGATPIQNVGAYGQEVSETIAWVRTFDQRGRESRRLTPEQCRFGYRTSALKGSNRHLVLEVCFELERSELSNPIAYAELADALGVEVGDRAPLGAVREAVLGLRRGKGMVIDPEDPDSVSAGSFFTNPILEAAAMEALQRRVKAALGPDEQAPSWPEPDGRLKTSAAWLIERAGFGRGYGSGPAAISGKHTLALVNRGAATTAELLGLAREIRDGVEQGFGVTLEPEPTLVGVSL